MVTDGTPRDGDVEIEAARHPGVESPDGDLQVAYHDRAKEVLDDAGVAYQVAGNGVAISGQINPVSATGLLVHARTEEARTFLLGQGDTTEDAAFIGTCFAFRKSNAVLAAAHCVGDLPPEALLVDFPTSRRMDAVVAIERHPVADLAVLQLGADVWPEGVEAFIDAGPIPALGEEFMAFGYPEDTLGPHPAQPVPRLFRGHFQRTFDYRRSRFNYIAGEISIPSPAGLSGGPLFSPHNFNAVAAIAAENLQSTTYVGRLEEKTEGGEIRRTVERDVVQYGIAVVLEPLGSWLEAKIPRRPRTP
jgi:hypothetical protein